MIALILLAVNLLAAPFKSKSRLEAENAVLRQQVIVLRHQVRGTSRPSIIATSWNISPCS
jgi:hypothetical protein